ncbi:hypothetical protein KFL_001050260 [Klebsormidium nitens]|uniref:Uncharacterized protein n=1 Tax=Klebsormidium nitens TaxID=105231 RepID=A0A1Y1HVR9_KLENI|nr:hypothetical protein KFL_001050260 [Klebsormidium nitens]|eukprot:GAQ82263.1 hypothetical protein KFL_001050260 [Klebsormidium nitens]
MADPAKLMEGHISYRLQRSQHLGEEELKQYEDLSRRLVLSQAEIFYLEKALYEREKDLLIAQERNRQLEEGNAKVPDKDSHSLSKQAAQLTAIETSVQSARQGLAKWHQESQETTLAPTNTDALVAAPSPSGQSPESAAEPKAETPKRGPIAEGSLATKVQFATVVDNLEASFGAYFAEVGQLLDTLAKDSIAKERGNELVVGIPGGPKGLAQAGGAEDFDLQAQIADLQAQIDVLSEGTERMQVELAAGAEQLLHLEEEVAEKDGNIAALRGEVDNVAGVKADLAAAEEHALALQTKLALTANEFFRSEADAASQSADLGLAEGQVAALALDLAKRDERIAGLLAELKTLRATAAKSNDSAEALKAELATARDAEVAARDAEVAARDAEVAARDAEVAAERVARDFEQIAAELEIAARAAEQRFAEVERTCAQQEGLILAMQEQLLVAGTGCGMPAGVAQADGTIAAQGNGGRGAKGFGDGANSGPDRQEEEVRGNRVVAEEGGRLAGSLAEEEKYAIGILEGAAADRAGSKVLAEDGVAEKSQDDIAEAQGALPGQGALHVARDEEAEARTERELLTARDAAEERAALLEGENAALLAKLDNLTSDKDRLVDAVEEERERFADKMETLQVEEERLRRSLEGESERLGEEVRRVSLENERLRDSNDRDTAWFESELAETKLENARLQEKIARCVAELEGLSVEKEALLNSIAEERAKSAGEIEALQKIVEEERARFVGETEVLLFGEERLRADLEAERATFAEQVDGLELEKATLYAGLEEQKQRFDSEMEGLLSENERLKEALETVDVQMQAALHELEQTQAKAGRNESAMRAELQRTEVEARVEELERACELAQADAERMEAGWRKASIRAGELEERVLGLKRSLYEKEAQLREAVLMTEKLAGAGKSFSGGVETEKVGPVTATGVPPGKGERSASSMGSGLSPLAIGLNLSDAIPQDGSPADSQPPTFTGNTGSGYKGQDSPVDEPGARALLEALGIDSAQSSPSLGSTPPAAEGSPNFHDLVNGQLGFVLSGGGNRLLSSGKLIHMDSLDAPARSAGRATGHVAAWDSALSSELEARAPGEVEFVGPLAQETGGKDEGDQVEITLSSGGDIRDFGSPVWSGRRVSGSVEKASPSPPRTPLQATTDTYQAETDTTFSPPDASALTTKPDEIDFEDPDTDTERSEVADVATESPQTLEKDVITSESSGTEVGLASASGAKAKRNLVEQFDSALAKREGPVLEMEKDAALAAAAALNVALAARVSELEEQLGAKIRGLNPGSEILISAEKAEVQNDTRGLSGLSDVGRVWVETPISRSHSRSCSGGGSVSASRVSTPGRARELEALRDELQRLQEKVAESEALADEVERAHREGVLRAECHVAEHEGFEALQAEVTLLRSEAARSREREEERERPMTSDVVEQTDTRPRDADPGVQGLEEKVKELERVVRGAREENARLAATWQGGADVGLEALEDELALLRGTRAENEELKGVIRDLEGELRDANQQEARDAAAEEKLRDPPREAEELIKNVDGIGAQATLIPAEPKYDQSLPPCTDAAVMESLPVSNPEDLGPVPSIAAALPGSTVPADSGAITRLQVEVRTLRAQLEASLVALQLSQAASAQLAAEVQGLQGLAAGRFSLELEVAELRAQLAEERGARGALQDELAFARAQLEELKNETERLATAAVARPDFETVGVQNPLYESPRDGGFSGGFGEGRPRFDSAVIRSEASSVAEALARDADVLGRVSNPLARTSDASASGSVALPRLPDVLARGPDASAEPADALAHGSDALAHDADAGVARSLSKSSLVRTSEDAEGWLVGEGGQPPSERISECFTVQYEPVEDSLFLPSGNGQLVTEEGPRPVDLATGGADELPERALEGRRKSLSVSMPTAQEWAFGATPRLNPLFGIEGELFSPLELPKRSQSMTDAVYLHQANKRAEPECESARLRELERLCFSRGEEVAALRALLEESQQGAHEGAELRAETERMAAEAERMAAELARLEALLQRKEEQLVATSVKLEDAFLRKATGAEETGSGPAEAELHSGRGMVGEEEPVDRKSDAEEQQQTEETQAEDANQEQLSRAASLEVDFLVADFVGGGRSEEGTFPVNIETSSPEDQTVTGQAADPNEIVENGVYLVKWSVGEAPDAPISDYVESSPPQDKSIAGETGTSDGAEENSVYHVKWSVGECPDALNSVVPSVEAEAEAEAEAESGSLAAERLETGRIELVADGEDLTTPTPARRNAEGDKSAAEQGPTGTESLLLRIDQLERERDAALRRARELEAEGLVDQVDLRVKGIVLPEAAGLVVRLREAKAQKREANGEVAARSGVQVDGKEESEPRGDAQIDGKVRERRASALEEEGRQVALWQAAGKLRCLKEQNEELLRTRPFQVGRLSDARGRSASERISDASGWNADAVDRRTDAVGLLSNAVEEVSKAEEILAVEKGLMFTATTRKEDLNEEGELGQELDHVRTESNGELNRNVSEEGGGKGATAVEIERLAEVEELRKQEQLDGEIRVAQQARAALAKTSADGGAAVEHAGVNEANVLERLEILRAASTRKEETLSALREELAGVKSFVAETLLAKEGSMAEGEAGAPHLEQLLAAYQMMVMDDYSLDVALGAARDELLAARDALAESFAGECETGAQRLGSESAPGVSETARDLTGQLEALVAECARKRGQLRAIREDLADLGSGRKSPLHTMKEDETTPALDSEEVARLSSDVEEKRQQHELLEGALMDATEALTQARTALADGFAAAGIGGGLGVLDGEIETLATQLAEVTQACERKERKIVSIHRELEEVQALSEGVAEDSVRGPESGAANGSGTEWERLSAAVEQKELEAGNLDGRLGAAQEELLSARAVLAARFECHVEAGGTRDEAEGLAGRSAAAALECARKRGMLRALREELADITLASMPVAPDEREERKSASAGEIERLSELCETREREENELEVQLVTVREQLSHAKEACTEKQRERMREIQSEGERESDKGVDAGDDELMPIRLEERSVECARKAGQLRALREELEEARKADAGTASEVSVRFAGDDDGRHFIPAEEFEALSAGFHNKVREESELDKRIMVAREELLAARSAMADGFAMRAEGEIPGEKGVSVEEFGELSARLEVRSAECARKGEKLRSLRTELEEVTEEVGNSCRDSLEETSGGESGRSSVNRAEYESNSAALEQKTAEANALDSKLEAVRGELVRARQTLADAFAHEAEGECPVEGRRVSGQAFEEVSARLEARSVECAGKEEKLRTLEAELADVRGLVLAASFGQPVGEELEPLGGTIESDAVVGPSEENEEEQEGRKKRIVAAQTETEELSAVVCEPFASSVEEGLTTASSDGDGEGKRNPSESEATRAGVLDKSDDLIDPAVLSPTSGKALALRALTTTGDSSGPEDENADVLSDVSRLFNVSEEADGLKAVPADSHNGLQSETHVDGPCSGEACPGNGSQSPRADAEIRWDEASTAEAYREKAAECSGYQEELRAVKEELQATRKSLTQFYEEIQIFTGGEIEGVVGGAGVEAVRKAVRRASVNALRMAEAARLQGLEKQTSADSQKEAVRRSSYIETRLPVDAEKVPVPFPVPAPSDQAISENNSDELLRSAILTGASEAVGSSKNDLAATEKQAAHYTRVGLEEEMQDLQGKHEAAVEELEAALGSLQAERAALKDLEFDRTADALVYSAILAGAEETVRVLKGDVRKAESRAAEYEQKSDSALAELTALQEALAAYTGASSPNEHQNPLEGSKEAVSAEVAQRDMTQLVTSAREELRQTAHKLAAARVELTTADAHLALLRAARDGDLPGETNLEEISATFKRALFSIESPSPVEEPAKVEKTGLENPDFATGKRLEEVVSTNPRGTRADEEGVVFSGLVNEAREELGKLHREVEETKRELFVTRGKLRATNEALSESRGAVQINRAETVANIEVESAHGRLEKATGELILLQGEVERTRGEARNNNQVLALTRGKLRATNEALSESRGALRDNRAEMASSVEELESAHGRQERATGELIFLQEALERTRGEVKAGEEDLTLTRGKLRATNETLSESQGGLQRNRAATVASVEELELAHRRLEKATWELILLKAKGELSILREELEMTRGDVTASNEGLALTRGKLRATNEALRESLVALERNREDTVASVEELESAQGRLDRETGELSSLREALERTRGEVRDSNQDLALTRGKLRATNEALSEGRGALQSNRADTIASVEELESAHGKLEKATGELKFLQEALERTREEVTSSNEDLTLARGRLDEANGEVGDARGKIESAREELRVALRELEIVKGRNTGVEEEDLSETGEGGPEVREEEAGYEEETVEMQIESASVNALREEVVTLHELQAATAASLQSAVLNLKSEQEARRSLETDKAVDNFVHSAIMAGAEEVLAEVKEDLQMAEGMAAALQDDLEYLQAELGAASDSLIDSEGPQQDEGLIDTAQPPAVQIASRNAADAPASISEEASADPETHDEQLEIARLREERATAAQAIAGLRLEVRALQEELAQKELAAPENAALGGAVAPLEETLSAGEESEKPGVPVEGQQAERTEKAGCSRKGGVEEAEASEANVGGEVSRGNREEDGKNKETERREASKKVAESSAEPDLADGAQVGLAVVGAAGGLEEDRAKEETPILEENRQLRANIARLEDRLRAVESVDKAEAPPELRLEDRSKSMEERQNALPEPTEDVSPGQFSLSSKEEGSTLHESLGDKSEPRLSSFMTPQGPGKQHLEETGGSESAAWGDAPSVRSADVTLTSQESGVDAFGMSGLLGSTLSSYSGSEPATRTNSLGAFEFGGLGVRARELPSVSETPLELGGRKASTEQNSVVALSESEAEAELGQRNANGETTTLFGAVVGEAKAIPLMEALRNPAAEAVTVCSVSCQMEGFFEPTKPGSAGTAAGGPTILWAQDAACQASIPSEDVSVKKGSKPKELPVWAWNPVAIPPSPSGTPERTPQGSFDLPIRVNRVESMLRGSGNGNGTGTGTGEDAEAEQRALSKSEDVARERRTGSPDSATKESEFPGFVPQTPPVLAAAAEKALAGNMVGASDHFTADLAQKDSTSRVLQSTSREETRSEAVSFDLPVRVGRLESLLGDQRQEAPGGRSPSGSFDLPVRVSRLESMLAGFSPSVQRAGTVSESVAPANESGSGRAGDGSGESTGESGQDKKGGEKFSGETARLEAYRRALVELPAVMFEAALFKRHLAELRRKHDVTETPRSESSQNTSGDPEKDAPESVEASHRGAVKHSVQAERKERVGSESERAVSDLVLSSIVGGARETVAELQAELAEAEARAAANLSEAREMNIRLKVELASNEDRAAAAERQLAAAWSEHAYVSAELENARSAHADVSAQLAALTEEGAARRTTLAASKKAHADVTAELAASLTAQADFRARLEEAQKEHADVRAALVASQEAHADVSAELMASQRAHGDVSLELAAEQRARSEAMHELEETQKAHADVISELEAVQRTRADVIEQLETAQKAHADVRAELEAAHNGHSDVSSELEAAKKAHTDLSTEVTAAERARDEAEARLAGALTETEDLRQAAAETERELSSAREETARLESDLAAAGLRIEQMGDAAAAAGERFGEVLAALERDLAAASLRVAEMGDAAAAAGERFREVSATLEVAENRVADLESAEEGRGRELESVQRRLEEEVAAGADSNRVLEEETVRLKGEIVGTQKRCVDAEREVEEGRARILVSQAELESARSEIEALKETLETNERFSRGKKEGMAGARAKLLSGLVSLSSGKHGLASELRLFTEMMGADITLALSTVSEIKARQLNEKETLGGNLKAAKRETEELVSTLERVENELERVRREAELKGEENEQLVRMLYLAGRDTETAAEVTGRGVKDGEAPAELSSETVTERKDTEENGTETDETESGETGRESRDSGESATAVGKTASGGGVSIAGTHIQELNVGPENESAHDSSELDGDQKAEVLLTEPADGLSRSPLGSFDLPVRVSRLESILLGDQEQHFTADRSPSNSFDLPVRVTQRKSIKDTPPSGDQTPEESTERSPSGSFDLPVRVTRLESMISSNGSAGISSDAFELPERVARLESMLGALSLNQPGEVTEGLTQTGESRESGPGLGVTGQSTQSQEQQKTCPVESPELEAYGAALAELPALMFEVALCKRQLANLRQDDVRPTFTKSTQPESMEGEAETEGVGGSQSGLNRTDGGYSGNRVDDLVHSAIVAGAEELVTELKAGLEAAEGRATALQRELDTLRAGRISADVIPPPELGQRGIVIPPKLGEHGIVQNLSASGHVPLAGTETSDEVESMLEASSAAKPLPNQTGVPEHLPREVPREEAEVITAFEEPVAMEDGVNPAAPALAAAERLELEALREQCAELRLRLNTVRAESTAAGTGCSGGTRSFSASFTGVTGNAAGSPVSQAIDTLRSQAGTAEPSSGGTAEPLLGCAWNPVAPSPGPSPGATPERTPQGSFELPVRVTRFDSMLPEIGDGIGTESGSGNGTGHGEERTPQGSFELPVRVTRIESMQRDSGNGNENENGNGRESGSGHGEQRTPQGSLDLPIRVARVESMLRETANGNGIGSESESGGGSETVSGSGTGEEAEAKQKGLQENNERSPAESLDLPVRITRLESMLSGRSTGEQTRNPSSAVDPPEGVLGVFTPDTVVGVNAKADDDIGDRSISTEEAGDSAETAFPTRFESASSKDSFDLPARVSRLESMLLGCDVRASSFELPQRVEIGKVSVGRTDGITPDGVVPEHFDEGFSAGKNVFGEVLAGNGSQREEVDRQRNLATLGTEIALVNGNLETYHQALVELPALMFEVALLRRQLAGRQQRNVTPTSTISSENESEEHTSRQALEALVARLREELVLARKREADVAIVKEELLSLRAELADREAALVAAAEALRASRIQGLEGLGASIMHRLSLTVSEPVAGREPEEEFGARAGREGKPRAKSETAAALPPMIVGLRRASLRGLEVLAWEAVAAERLRSASAPATLQRSAEEGGEGAGRRHFNDVITKTLPIERTEEADRNERTEDVMSESVEDNLLYGAPVRKARSEPLALQMDHVSFAGDSVEQELRDQVVSLTSLLSARERAHEEVPSLRREVARLERALKQQATESADARADSEREISWLRGALEECEARCEVLRAEVLEVTRTRVESGVAGHADELWMVVPRAAAGSEGEEALRQQVQHLQRVIATMVREMAPDEKELAQLRALSRQNTVVEERASALSLEVTSIQRSVRASMESSVSSLDGGSSRRLSALDAAASPRSDRASEGFEEHVEQFTMGMREETMSQTVGDVPRLESLLSDSGNLARLEVTVHDISSDDPWLPTPLSLSEVPTPSGRSGGSSRAESRRHSGGRNDLGAQPPSRTQSWRHFDEGKDPKTLQDAKDALTGFVTVPDIRPEVERNAKNGTKAKRPPVLTVPTQSERGGNAEGAKTAKSYVEIPGSTVPAASGFRSTPTSPRAALTRSQSGSSAVSSQRNPRGGLAEPRGRIPGTRSAGNSIEKMTEAKTPGRKSGSLSQDSRTSVSEEDKVVDSGGPGSRKESSASGGPSSAASTPPGTPRKRKGPWKPPSVPSGAGRLHLKMNPAQAPEEKTTQ